MDPHPISSVPFRKQETRWTCGAASLRMVYASYGLELSEAEVWTALQPDPRDRSGVFSSRVAWEARRRGYSALALQARRPWDLLSTCARLGVRVVFDQPLTRGSPRRHFSILVHLGDDEVVLHDPQFGPDCTIRKAEWLELWGAVYGNVQAVPNELVAIANSDQPASDCVTCGEPLPESCPCPVCREVVPLRPGAVLGCVVPDCPGRLWEHVACPVCDHRLTRLDGTRSGDLPSSDSLEGFSMPNGDPFQTLNAAMNEYQRKVAKMQGVSSDAGVRDVLGKLQESMKFATDKLGASLGKFEEQIQERTKQLDQRRANAEKKMKEAKQAKEEAQAMLAAKKAAKAARPQIRSEPDDPNLGEKLRDKLLEEFGTRVDRHPTAPPETLGSLIDFDPGA